MFERKINWKFKPVIYAIDALGYLIVRPFLRKQLPEEIRKILVIRVDEIGDAILSAPVFRALKQRFPEAELHVLTKPLNREVYENNLNVDYLIFTASWLNTWTGRNASFFDYIRLVKRLRKENFDLVVELHTDPRNILLASLAGKFAIGYGYRGFGFLLNKKAVLSGKRRHIIDQHLAVAGLAGADSSPELELNLTDEAVKSIREKLREKGCSLSRPQRIVCISSGAGRKNKLWINSRWAGLIRAILKKKNLYIVLTGAASETETVNDIISTVNSKRVINLCGQTSLSELFALVSHSSLVIAPDSAIIHVARAVSVPSVGIYGPTDPAIWGYNDKMHKSVFRKLDCSFCNKSLCRLRHNKNKCMEWISLQDVLREAETFI